MNRKSKNPFVMFVLVLVMVSLACATSQPPTPTSTPKPSATSTATVTPSPTKTVRPSPTPRPTKTPNLAATQRTKDLQAEIQGYFDAGYVATTDGKFVELDDFSYDWAQLGWYQWLPLGSSASDFVMAGHFEWTSASNVADTSGCGFVFGLQSDNSHYAVFLDRSKVLVLVADAKSSYSRSVGKTRGSGRVKFTYPAEADFVLIVNGTSAYVLVDNELIGQYTLSKNWPSRGGLGLTVLSGTNKDYGTRCKMTNLHLWTPASD